MFSAQYFAHANVNTVDFDRSFEFYTTVLGLGLHGMAEPTESQSGDPFGLPGQSVRFRGALLTDGRKLPGPAVDLLEWTAPSTARPPDGDTAQSPGFRALKFAVADLDATRQHLQQWDRPITEATLETGVDTTPVLLTEDPDGLRLELTEDARTLRYQSVRVNCADLARSAEFYTDVIHLACDDATPYRLLADGAVLESGRFRRAYLPGQREKFWLELTEVAGAPPAAPSRAGNTAGVYRVALRVLDIDAAYEDLRHHLPQVRKPDQIPVHPDYPPVPAIFFADPDGSVLEYLIGIYT